MKLKGLIGLIGLLVMLLAMGVLARDPPSFENQQFLGNVYWDTNVTAAATPQAVTAQLASGSYTSIIKEKLCSESICSGTYGKQADNILRVQGTTGQLIRFYIGSELVGNASYTPDAITPLHFNLSVRMGNGSLSDEENETNRTGPRPGCVPNWLCGSWSVCEVNISQLRSCIDRNSCDPDQLSRNETQRCGANTTASASSTAATCTYEWQCTAWGACSPEGEKTRSCQRVDQCDIRFARGEVQRVISTSAEERKECTPTPPISPPTPPPLVPPKSPLEQVPSEAEKWGIAGGIAWYFWAGPLALIILGGGGFFLYRWWKAKKMLSDASTQQLRAYVQRHLQQGQAPGQIQENLVEGGWEEKTVEKFFKKFQKKRK